MSRNRRTGMITPGFRPGQHADPIRTAPGSTHRNGLPVRTYEYHGTGGSEDESTGITAAPALRPPAAIAVPDAGLPVVDVRLALCPLCAADLCGFGCFEGPCKCACQDWRTP